MDSDAWSTTSLGKFSIFKTLFRFNHFKEDSSDNGTSLLWFHESEILKLRTSKDLEYHREPVNGVCGSARLIDWLNSPVILLREVWERTNDQVNKQPTSQGTTTYIFGYATSFAQPTWASLKLANVCSWHFISSLCTSTSFWFTKSEFWTLDNDD